MYKWFNWCIIDLCSVNARVNTRGYPCAKGCNSSASQWLSGEQVRLCLGHPKVHFGTIVEGSWGGCTVGPPGSLTKYAVVKIRNSCHVKVMDFWARQSGSCSHSNTMWASAFWRKTRSSSDVRILWCWHRQAGGTFREESTHVTVGASSDSVSRQWLYLRCVSVALQWRLTSP